jgi:hypothetical protein
MFESAGRVRPIDTASGPPEHRRHMRRRPAVLAVAMVVTLAVGAGPEPAHGHHGGRDISSLFTCLELEMPPRCTSVADDLHVAFDDSLSDGLAESLAQAMAEAYDGPTKLTMVVDESPTDRTDAIAFSTDYGENGAAGWVYCPRDAPQGVNPSDHRWCRGQEIHFNLNPRYSAFFADDGSRDHVTCHELGHTIGLRHWGNPPETDEGGVGATCMNANTPDGPARLHQFDIDHINAYDFRRVPAAPSSNGPQAPPRLLPWRGMVAMTEVEPLPATLDELVASADAVVRGQITSVVPGRVFGANARPLHYASATLEVDAILAGAIPRAHRSVLTLEIPLFDGPSSIGDLPAWGEGIFLLRSKATSAREAGLPPALVRAESAYYRLLTFTGLVTNDRDVAVTAAESGPLATLSGMPFEAAARAIRSAGR